MQNTALRDLDEQPQKAGQPEGSTDGSSRTPEGDAWEELYRLGEEIGRGWASPKSAVEILSEMRR